MKFEAFGRPKSKEELEKQAKKAEAILGEKMYPPDTSVDISDAQNIQDKYKTRYDAYVATLRALHGGELDTQEIKNAREWINALNNLDTYIKDHESKNNPTLREKQFIVFKKIRDFLEQGKRKGYIKLPAGTGKTILFLKIAEALGMKTMVVSPSVVILGQNAEETEEFTESEFGKYYGEEKDLTKKVTHITYHSLVKATKSGKINPDNVPVLILDEAHRAVATERAQVVKKFHGLQLGFTATSEFSEDRKVADLLDEEIFRMDVSEGIREGLISNTKTIHVYTSVDLSSVDTKSGQYDKVELETVTNVLGRNKAAVELYKKKFSHLKLICNCSGVAHAQAVAKLFNEQGITAACITGNTPPGDKEGQRGWILNKYKEGAIKVLTNAKVLLEGFNEPTCSVTFNLNPTLSLVDAEQRVRSGRLDKNDPQKWNYVIDFIDKNSQKPQILYSEILTSDKVWDLSKVEALDSTTQLDQQGEQAIRESNPPIDFNDFSVEGLRVVMDEHTIMEVTKKNKDTREKWTLETLQTDVREKKILSSRQYEDNAPLYRWPRNETLNNISGGFPKNPDGSKDWDTFLGREKKEKFDFEKFRLEVIAKGIVSSSDYRRNSSIYKWPDMTTLRAKPEFPKSPDGSPNWDAFFERAKSKWTYATLQTDVKKAKITSSNEYIQKRIEKNWPSYYVVVGYSEFPKNPDGSFDWDTFLGREKFDLGKFQAEVKTKNLKSTRDYINAASQYGWPSKSTLLRIWPDFPKNPDGSFDWDTFLGREKKEKFDFEKLKQQVVSKGIKSTKEYRRKSSENSWPYLTVLVAMPEFPKNPDGSNDWDTFLGKNKK